MYLILIYFNFTFNFGPEFIRWVMTFNNNVQSCVINNGITSDIMDVTAEENFPGLMISIDFQKAFDAIEWCYLQRRLESFNFGPEFIRWVMTFNNNVQSCVINNGFTSDYFTLERGVRQGDPLSPHLFGVAVKETLAIEFRQNTAIKGITIGKDETKLLQYADNTTAVLSDAFRSHPF